MATGCERRIAFVSDHADPTAALGGEEAGGQNVFVRETALALTRAGWSVDVFTRSSEPRLTQAISFGPGARLFRICAGPNRRIGKHQLSRHLPEFFANIMDCVQRYQLRYDVVHGHYYLSGWLAASMAQRLHVPMVQSFHSLGAARAAALGAQAVGGADRIALEQAVAHASARIVALSTGERDLLVRAYGAAPDKVKVIAGGIDPYAFRPGDRARARMMFGLPPDAVVVLYVGRTLPEKGLETLIRAVDLVVRPDPGLRRQLRLVIVGGPGKNARACAAYIAPDESETARLVKLSHALNVGDVVCFVGSVQHDLLPEFYRAANIGVLPSIYEPFGLAALEAMSSGLPVVVSDRCGMAALIIDGESGLVFPAGDHRLLAHKIRLLLDDGDLRRHIGQQARRTVAPELAWSSVADALLQLYQSLHRSPRLMTMVNPPGLLRRGFPAKRHP